MIARNTATNQNLPGAKLAESGGSRCRPTEKKSAEGPGHDPLRLSSLWTGTDIPVSGCGISRNR